MQFFFTDNDIEGAEFFVNGQPFTLRPVSSTTEPVAKSVDKAKNTDEGDNIHSSEEDGCDPEDASMSDGENKIVEDTEEEDTEEEAHVDDGETGEQFMIHHDKNSPAVLSGRYLCGVRTGVWQDVAICDSGEFRVRSFDFDRMSATFRFGRDVVYDGQFKCTDNAIQLIGEWTDNEKRVILKWIATKPYARCTINGHNYTLKALVTPDLDVLKCKQRHKNGTISYSEDLEGYIKFKNGNTIHGAWVLYNVVRGKRVRIVEKGSVNNYMLRTTDGKYFHKAGYRLNITNRDR